MFRCVRRFVSTTSGRTLGVEELNKRMRSMGLPKALDARITKLDVSEGRRRIEGELELHERHLSPNGYCHAGTLVSFADTLCGAGTFALLPSEARNFTTIELKTNLVRTALSGTLKCEAIQLHAGRRTQVWDATVYTPSGKPMCYFRCTQIHLFDNDENK